MGDGIKPVREWTSPDGFQCVELPDGETYMHLEDLPAFVMTLDPASCADATKRAAVERFQREAVLLAPAARFRRAIALFDEIGAPLPEGFRTTKPKLVK